MMQDHLRPDLGMYIELGNEAWHGKFFDLGTGANNASANKIG